jgi:hypothetical protein
VGVTETKEVVNTDNEVVGMRSDDHENEEVNENVSDNANEDVTVETEVEERVAKEPIVYRRKRFKSQGIKSGVRGSRWVHHNHMSLSLQSQISPQISLHP